MSNIKENKEKICVCTGHTKRKSKTFDTYEELIIWAREQIKVGDLVEVKDTGFCFTHASNRELKDFYYQPDVDVETYIDIINHFNHKSLGYSEGVKSIDKKDCYFKVIAEFGNKYVIEAEEGDKYFDYIDGYYIIGKEGVKKLNAWFKPCSSLY